MMSDEQSKPLTYNSSGVMSQDRDAIVENSNRILAKTLHKADQMLIEALRNDVLMARNAHSKAQERIAELQKERDEMVTLASERFHEIRELEYQLAACRKERDEIKMRLERLEK